MASGIYKLTFKSGNFYIGKSNNIDRRWQEHFDKFKKGTAAKNMQAEPSTLDLLSSYDKMIEMGVKRHHAVASLCQEFGLQAVSVRSALYRYGRGQEGNEKKHKQAMEMLALGKKPDEIADGLGVDRATVFRWAAAARRDSD